MATVGPRFVVACHVVHGEDATDLGASVKRMMRTGRAVAGLGAGLVLLAGCTTGSGTVSQGAELNTPTRLSMSHAEFTGHKQAVIQVADGQTVSITVNVVTLSGRLDARVESGDGKASRYEGHSLPTTGFVVTLRDPGTYTVRVDATRHVGSYSVSWEPSK